MDIGRRHFLAASPAIGSLAPSRPLTQPARASDPLGVRADFPATTRAALDGAHCRVSVRENGTQIRVSPALFNTRDDVRRFLDLAAELHKSR